MGIYGNMMNSFQALFKDLEYFDMLPLINSGYDITKDREGDDTEPETIRGSIQNIKSNSAKTSNGNFIIVRSGTLWTEELRELGKFIRDSGVNYRIMQYNGWDEYGGFHKYELEEVVGNPSDASEELEINTGEQEMF